MLISQKKFASTPDKVNLLQNCTGDAATAQIALFQVEEQHAIAATNTSDSFHVRET
jgi:hypothetical protein